MSNSYTKGYADGSGLTESELDTALQTLQLDIANTALTTTGSTSGHVLTSNGSAVASSFQAIPDPMGPFALRNYGLKATVASGVMTLTLTTKAGTAPTGIDSVDFNVSTNGTTSASYRTVTISAATTLAVNASASLGFSYLSTASVQVFMTSTQRVFVYGYYNTVTSSVKLAASSVAQLDAGAAVTTTALSASADVHALYATAALTVVPRLLGWVQTAISSAGAWQTPTKVNITNQAGRSVAISASCGAFSTTSTTATAVTKLTRQVTVSGRPVSVGLIPDGTAGNFSTITANKSSANSTNLIEVRWLIKRDSTIIAQSKVSLQVATATTATFLSELPSTIIQTVDTPTMGTYTYTVAIQVVNAAGEVDLNYAKLAVFEL